MGAFNSLETEKKTVVGSVNNSSKKKRDSNIELLRIVLMLMIITHHVIVHGLGLRQISTPEYKISFSTYWELAINSFVVIYLIARYMARYKIEIKHSSIYFVVSIGAIYWVNQSLLYSNNKDLIWKSFSYNNALLVLAPVFLFYTFKKLTLGYCRVINTVAATTLGIYMIHDYRFMREEIAELVSYITESGKINAFWTIFYLIALVIAILMVSSSLEMIRKYVFNVVYENLKKRFRKIEEWDSKMN